jgi:hypothetical protein
MLSFGIIITHYEGNIIDFGISLIKVGFMKKVPFMKTCFYYGMQTVRKYELKIKEITCAVQGFFNGEVVICFGLQLRVIFIYRMCFNPINYF